MPCGLSKVITRQRLCGLSNANACQQRANREEAEGGLSGRLPFLFLLKPGEAGFPHYITVGRQADTLSYKPSAARPTPFGRNHFYGCILDSPKIALQHVSATS